VNVDSERWNHLLDTLRLAAPPQVGLFLVGGAVRDLLAGRPVHDLDLVIVGEVRPLARRVANALSGDFYMLDEERDTARVIDHSGDQAVFLDFCSLRAPDLTADLWERDFTINAVALDLRRMDQPVDPTGGVADLKLRRLRACTPQALQNDPVRVLRGVRQSISLGFSIEPNTLRWMGEAAPHLGRVSNERLRDELFRMLEGRQASQSMAKLDELGVLRVLLPELLALKGVVQSPPHLLDVWQHTLTLLKTLEALWAVLVDGDPAAAPENGSVPDWTMTSALQRLGRFQAPLRQHFSLAVNPGRSLRALLFLAGLYHDAAKPQARTVEAGGRVRFFHHEEQGAGLALDRARALALSQVEAQRLETLVRQHMRIHLLSDPDQALSRRAIFRYFRDTGPAGVELALLSLADMLATYGATLPKDIWQAELESTGVLWEAWFEKPAQAVRPPRLLNGGEVMAAFGLAPGPLVGQLLAAVQEAQAAGEIDGRQAALDYARAILDHEGGFGTRTGEGH